MNGKKQYKVLDLFCGCGGLSSGFSNAGYEVLLGIDHWSDALTTFSHNHPGSRTLQADLQELAPEDVSQQFNISDIDVIVGGPPCQGFSIAGKRIIDDARNKLYKSFVRFVEYFSPNAFVMENVPNILSIGNGAVKEEIFSDFKRLGYKVQCKVLCAADYGVPQNRRRAFFVGLKDRDFSFPPPTTQSPVTCREALGDLPEMTLADGASYPTPATTEYQKLMRKSSQGVYNHLATVHTEQTKKIISMVPDGGNYLDLPLELQNTRKVHIAWTRFRSDRPSFTIDTGHNHHFHYEYNRVPTARESARLQSFPDDYIFLCNKTSQLKQIGNAVPPLLALAVAVHLRSFLQ